MNFSSKRVAVLVLDFFNTKSMVSYTMLVMWAGKKLSLDQLKLRNS